MIEVTNLTKRYAGRTAVADISFTVARGEVVGLLGPNGAGKSTTMRILACFLPATSGTARVAGYDVFHESDEVRRRIAPLKCSTDEWLTVMRVAHHKGLKSTATMMFGVGEESRHRVAHLLRLRDLQDETRGFTAFICWPFQPDHTRLAPGDGSAHAYLRTTALSRLVLDNVPNLQASWVTMGGGVAQAALHMGCNDFGQVMIEENVVSAAGTTFRMDSEEVERHIRDAGFRVARRNMRYQVVEDRPA